MRLDFQATTVLAVAWFCTLGLGDSLGHGSKPVAAVCESKTINYITHTLPQQCLRTAWTSEPATAATTTTEGAPPTPTSAGSVAAENDGQIEQPLAEKQAPGMRAGDEQKEEPQDKPGPAEEAAQMDQEDLATSSFMSFEEWKEMMLRKSGQDPAQIKQHDKPHKEHKGHKDAGDVHADLDSLGDDGEISIDFDALSDKVSELTAAKSGEPGPQRSSEAREEQVLLDDGKMQYYRSKDAGKTCKERFSYSSFDAGATVLKTSPGAKNAKSILVENKDSYMLLECHAKNKFVIVELSDDILVDTVVLANFEFFSSMIRKFRVSVSDRYPVKLDKWVELGTFEARNSRDIQAFLIEHPQIYTKYIRIEFLTHYGNEYYCPVSLLRVHGTRMLDSWKEPDNSRDDDDLEPTLDASPEDTVPDAHEQDPGPSQEPAQPSDATEQNRGKHPVVVPPVSEVNRTNWSPLFRPELPVDTCRIEAGATESPTAVAIDRDPVKDDSFMSVTASQTPADTPSLEASRAASVPVLADSPETSLSSSSSRWPSSSPTPVPSTDSAASSKAADATPSSTHQHPSPKANATEPPSSPPIVKGSAASTVTTKNKTSTSTASSASPTVQEGFFKAVTKRLQHLETNTSLSLQYIEEQSRFLQDALQKMEKRQVSRVDAFLDSLNKTVFAELRNVRTQYDQIWQSTVIALESQREQSQRETVALSERVSLLADEVVFQKRMAILQSVLLLAALVLVIFSRGYYVNAPGAEYYPMSSPFRHRNHSTSISAPALVDSPSRSPQSDDLDRDSPEFSGASLSPARTGSLRRPLSRTNSYQDKDLPLTPVSKSAASSTYSRDPNPSINVGEVDVPFFHDVAAGAKQVTPPGNRRDDSLPLDDSEVPSSLEGTPVRTSGQPAGTPDDEYMSGPDILDRIQAQHEQQQQQQQVNNARWSAMAQLGGARKPLPALPEDGPED